MSLSLLTEMVRAVDSAIVFPLLRLPQLTNGKGAGADDTLLRIEGIFSSHETDLPFMLRIKTRFLDFPDKNSIRFTWHEEIEPQVLEANHRYQLLTLPEVRVERFSFELECYKSTSITRLTGFGPVAAERLVMSVDCDSFYLRITSEGLKNVQSLPLAAGDLMQKLDQVISPLLNFSIMTDYQAHQKELA
jgi:hypothetical protein